MEEHQQRAARSTERVIWIGIALTLPLLLLGTLLLALKARTIRSQPLPVYATVADFTLTNQNGHVVTLEDLRGHVWVADIVFTRCAGPCPKMTRDMELLQAQLRENTEVKFVTLTTDPEFDTPQVMAEYAKRFNADPKRWWFLTGDKAEIARLAVGSLKLTAIEKGQGEQQSPDDLFIHSTLFVLIDKAGRVRGFFETAGEGVDPQATQARLLSAIRRLERES